MSERKQCLETARRQEDVVYIRHGAGAPTLKMFTSDMVAGAPTLRMFFASSIVAGALALRMLFTSSIVAGAPVLRSGVSLQLRQGSCLCPVQPGVSPAT